MLLTGNQDMDEGQLGDELKTMLLAGHETTSTMLTWTLYLLLTHPEVLAKVGVVVAVALPAGALICSGQCTGKG